MFRHAFAAIFAAASLAFPSLGAAHEGHDAGTSGPKPFAMEDLIDKARADQAAQSKEAGSASHDDHKPGDKDEAQASTVTVEGEFIDISCNTIHQSEGPEHASCAEKCAAAGMPVALRDAKDGKLYLLITEEHFVNAAGPALGKMGEKVVVTGKLLKNVNLDMIIPVKVELAKATQDKSSKPAKKN